MNKSYLQRIHFSNNRHQSTVGLFIVGLTACIAIGISSPARGQAAYTLEDMGVVKDMVASEPSAINYQGHVAGTGYNGSETCAFHYNYVTKFMADAGGVNSRGFGISSNNIVVGDNFFSTPGAGPILVSRA